MVNTVPTVSDTKRAFYSFHKRPVNSVYRRVVEELLVEMHLLRVNSEFCYDAIYALGVVTAFDRFMDGYEPAAEHSSIFQGLCQAQGYSPEQLRGDAQRLLGMMQSKSIDDLQGWFKSAVDMGNGDLEAQVQAIARRPTFKYSRLFGIGLYTLIEAVDAALVKDVTRLQEVTQTLCEVLGCQPSKLQKDLELYQANLDKIQQARQTIAEIVESDRKLQEKRLTEQQAKTESDAVVETASPNADSPSDPSASG
jgi:photosystem II biogenesis protein Psp29